MEWVGKVRHNTLNFEESLVHLMSKEGNAIHIDLMLAYFPQNIRVQ